MAKDVIVACDFPSGEKTLEFLDLFRDVRKPFVKIGMELFYSEGPSIVKEIKNRGHKIFLDLKLCDIPNTVESAMRQLAKLGVDMTNVHAYGGIRMMERALKGLSEGAEKTYSHGSCDGGKAVNGNARTPVLIAVTELTSTDQEMLNNELLIQGDINEVIKKYALNTKAAGLGGVVCSPLEAGIIHEACGEDFLTVTPGVRFEGGSSDDQSRITTPAKAKLLGSDYIVVGRPITQAEDPVQAYLKTVKEFL